MGTRRAQVLGSILSLELPPPTLNLHRPPPTWLSFLRNYSRTDQFFDCSIYHESYRQYEQTISSTVSLYAADQGALCHLGIITFCRKSTASPSRPHPFSIRTSSYTMSDYNSMKVPELKKLLQSRSLGVTGNKADLVARLVENDKENAPGM